MAGIRLPNKMLNLALNAMFQGTRVIVFLIFADAIEAPRAN